MASSSVVEPSPASSAAAKIGRFLRRLFLLLLAAALVVSVGTVVSTVDDRPAPLSTTERLRMDAEHALLAAAAGLEALAGTESGNDGGSRLAGQLAADLRQQAALFPLVTTWPSGSPEARDPAAGTAQPGTNEPSPGVSSSTAPRPAPTPQQALDSLSAAHRLLLDGSQAADPGLARLLASVGASVHGQALALHRAFPETKAPAPWRPAQRAAATCPPAVGGSGAASPAAASGTADPAAPGTQGTNEAQAVAGVVVSEYRAIFTYEAVLPRLSGAARTAAEERYAAHRTLAGRWEDLAGSACVELPLREAAYPLAEDPVGKPREAVMAAEETAAAALADAVAFGGPLRGEAASDLVGAAAWLAGTEGRPPLTPGLPEAAPQE
jgi:Domain of unknown function (DUF4439)